MRATRSYNVNAILPLWNPLMDALNPNRISHGLPATFIQCVPIDPSACLQEDRAVKNALPPWNLVRALNRNQISLTIQETTRDPQSLPMDPGVCLEITSPLLENEQNNHAINEFKYRL